MQGKVYINIEEMNSFMVWRIRDEGPGIPSEEVFSPFYTSKENGYGLGLAIAKRQVVEGVISQIKLFNAGSGWRTLSCVLVYTYAYAIGYSYYRRGELEA